MYRIEKIINLIELKTENEIVDFKREYYHDSKKYDLIKDLISFANSFSFGEKYIIIGIDNEFRKVVGITSQSVPDISDINQLIKMYCEPFINIELTPLKYDNKDLMAIVITDKNNDKPYTVCKDFMVSSKKVLSAGDVYIRKSANNFKALRADLEDIYNNRDVVEVSETDQTVCFRTITNIRQKEKMCCIAFNVANNTDKNFVIGKSTIRWIYPGTSTGCDTKYIDDDSLIFTKGITPINQIPFSIVAKTQYQKMLYVNISDNFCEVIREHERQNINPHIVVSLFDALKREYKFCFIAKKVIWEM